MGATGGAGCADAGGSAEETGGRAARLPGVSVRGGACSSASPRMSFESRWEVNSSTVCPCEWATRESMWNWEGASVISFMLFTLQKIT